MCLSAEALAVFLNLIAFDGITMEPGRIIIPAELNEAHWVRVDADDKWCTMAPQLDRIVRFAALEQE